MPQEALSRVSSFDALGSVMFKPIGLAIAAPLSTLMGMQNLIFLLAGITVLAIVLPLFSKEVWNMSYEDLPKDQVSLR